MVVAIALLVIAAGMVAAGAGHVRKAHAMRHFRSTTGQVLSRGVAATSVSAREGVWGRGGGYTPAVTYRYEVDGQAFTGDRVGYVRRGLRRSLAEQAAAAYPDTVEVWFDPASPGDAYLERHTPGLGWALVAGGSLMVLVAVVLLAGG